MAKLGTVVYLSEAQYQTLLTNGTITVGGVTVTYSANDIYVTPQLYPSAADVGAIPAPASPSVGDFLVYTSNGWAAQSVPSANGVSF